MCGSLITVDFENHLSFISGLLWSGIGSHARAVPACFPGSRQSSIQISPGIDKAGIRTVSNGSWTGSILESENNSWTISLFVRITVSIYTIHASCFHKKLAFRDRVSPGRAKCPAGSAGRITTCVCVPRRLRLSADDTADILGRNMAMRYTCHPGGIR